MNLALMRTQYLALIHQLIAFSFGAISLAAAGTLATSLPAQAINQWDVNLFTGSGFSAEGSFYTSNNTSDGLLNAEIVDWDIDLISGGVTQFTLTPANTIPVPVLNSDNSLLIDGSTVPKDIFVSPTINFASFTLRSTDSQNQLFFGERFNNQLSIGIIINGTQQLNDNFSQSIAFATGGAEVTAVPFEFSPSTGLVLSLGLFGIHHFQKQRKLKSELKL
jgi:hypothetical protein